MIRIFTYSLIFLAVVLGNNSYAQNQKSAYCWAPKGINMRDKPSGKGALLGKIAYKAKVTVLDTIFDAPYTDTLNHSIAVNGHWVKIKQGNVTGYAFDGYLSLIQPQTLYQYFEGTTPVTKDSTVNLEGATVKYQRQTYTRTDKSFYRYIVEEGCWDHTYYIKGATFNDGLMLISTTEPHEPEDCEFKFTKVAGNKFYFADCAATQNRMLEIVNDGIIYTTNDCD